MTALAEGQSSSCSVPALQLFAVDPTDNFLRDIDSGTFRILDPDGAEIVAATAIDTADCPTGNRLGAGRYVAPWTVPATPKLGVWSIEWTYKHTAAGADRTQTISFEVLGAVADPLARTYTTVAAMRAAGVKPKTIKAGALRDLIVLASAYVEHFTGRYFVPQAKDALFDGTGGRGIQVNEPIIALSRAEILLASFEASGDGIDPTAIRVYNRHLTQGLLDPDDRENPKIEFYIHGDSPGSTSFAHDFVWTKGRQNIQLDGVWGYTDPNGTPLGKTPALIEHAAKLLVMRNLAPLGDVDKRQDAQNAWRLTELRTRDQQIKYGFESNRGAMVGGMTGDPEIDSILTRYTRPIHLGAA
jgi:hypothetical protein